MPLLSSSDYPPYYTTYIAQVQAENILPFLQQQEKDVSAYFRALPADKWDHAYAAGKWTVKEVLGHLYDSEIIFGYRALAFARGEQQALPGYDQDRYVTEGRFAELSGTQLTDLWQQARQLNILSFATFDTQAEENTGTANGNIIRVRAIPYIVAGHVAHHLSVLKERY